MVGFKYGNFVRLQGLNNAAYNGKLAIIKCLSVDEHNGRFLVELQVDEVAPDLSREMLVKPENMMRACDCCRHGGAATMQYCGKCRNAAYCNAECQRNDWQRHKVNCNEMCAERQLVKNPLHIAACQGNLAAVESLVRAGADVNKAFKTDGCTALITAAEYGRLAVVRYLLQQGANKNKANKNGVTPLYLAAQRGHLTVVQYLVQEGTDKNKATDRGATPLFIAAMEDRLEVVQYLVRQGSHINQAANDGMTPLFVASCRGHLAIVQHLVQQRASINQPANDGDTPLAVADEFGRTAVACYLREQGAI